MSGQMFFAQTPIQDLRRSIQGLSLEERGLVLSFFVENCEFQGPIPRDEARLARRFGMSGRKNTLSRLINVLVEQKLLLEDPTGLIAVMAKNAIDHFETRSEQGRYANSQRRVRKNTEVTSQEELPAEEGVDSCAIYALGLTDLEGEAVSPDGEDRYTLELDRLIVALHSLATRAGAPQLADALSEDATKRKVEGWLEAGLTRDQVISTVKDVIRSKGDGAIMSWQYFDRALENMAARKAAPKFKNGG